MPVSQEKKGEEIIPKEGEGHSIGQIIGEIGKSTKDLIQSEIDLARAEIRESASTFGRFSAQTAAFGAFLSLSALSFLAFLVIGLGELLGGNYWLSSLIISACCGVIGGAMAYRALHRMKEKDLSLPHTREALQQGAQVMTQKLHEVKETAQGTVESTKRRAS